MRGATTSLVVTGLLAMTLCCGCLKSVQDGVDGGPSGNTGGTASSGGSVGSGGSASGGSLGSGGAVSVACQGIVDAFSEALAETQSCEADMECGQVLTGTSCGCTGNLVARLDADVSEVQRLMAVEVNGERCVQLASTCDCPEADGYTCNQGACGWNYVDPQRACCTRQQVTWGPSGGLVVAGSQPVYAVEGCTFHRELRGDRCSAPLTCDDALSGADVDAALEHPDVQAALEKAPLFFGYDTRVFDGPVLRIAVATDKATVEVEVGAPCEGRADCTPIPEGVSDLVALLNRLATQLTEEGRCVDDGAPALCSLPAEVGDCDAAIPRFFFNSESGQCEAFTYGGCGGNGNNFESLRACAGTCGQNSVPVCEQPVQPGPCRAAIPRFFFNSESGQCEAFTYGGCGGNGNNFETDAACNATCVSRSR